MILAILVIIAIVAIILGVVMYFITLENGWIALAFIGFFAVISIGTISIAKEIEKNGLKNIIENIWEGH